ncbi:hypothetical protein [Halobacillus sp. Marseille-P3879]|uniref:hypothetical protein n=1 Tax=Halobacillus sp. Marseille-P3879 TaxID=2045014 RepID=UPI000C7A43A8|nr:hypothetical protein [Halobacillus sp. Marseille-P3879]
MLLVGCSSEKLSEAVIHEEKTAPNELLTEDLVAHKAFNQNELEELWEHYNLSEALPPIKWKESSLLFIAAYESSSCPHAIINEEFRTEEKKIHYQTKEHEGDCTMDASPKTIVTKIQRSKADNLSKVQLGNKLGKIHTEKLYH